MNQKIKIGSSAVTLTLTDKHYKAAGGEASIYVHGGFAYKIYHEPKKKMLPVQKMTELKEIHNPQVIIPQEVIYDAATSEPLGYSMTYVDGVEPLLKFFTKTFKDDSNIDPGMIATLVRHLQYGLVDIHTGKCLAVDFNELNVLVNIERSSLSPWFIDTDSYATPSFKATAIMDSVRDRRVSTHKSGQLHYAPDELSDWFSWGVLSFWLYTNIHPFRGNHPNYKPRDKGKQMDDNISVFHKGVRVPPTTNDFKVIPKRHLDWFKEVFGKNERSIPPMPDTSAPIAVPTAIIVIKGTDKLEVVEIATYPEPVLWVCQFMGVNYVVTRSHVYSGTNETAALGRAKKVLLCQAADGTIIVATQIGTRINFTELIRGDMVGSINSTGMFARNGAIYTVVNGKLAENTFTRLSNRLVHRVNEIENVSNFTATIYEGCIIQDLLGRKYLTMPYAKGRSFSKYLPQLDGFRVIEARSELTVTVIIAEKGSVYTRFIVVFDKAFTNFEIRETKDVAYDAINFTVTDNRLCLLLANPTELELFVDAKQFETLNDPPFDSTMRLFSTPDGLFFINQNSIHQIKRK